MLQIFPFLPWLAFAISGVLLAALWIAGEVRPGTLVVLGTWFAAAAYCQFLVGSAIVSALGLAGQTLLAACLIVRWRLAG